MNTLINFFDTWISKPLSPDTISAELSFQDVYTKSHINVYLLKESCTISQDVCSRARQKVLQFLNRLVYRTIEAIVELKTAQSDESDKERKKSESVHSESIRVMNLPEMMVQTTMLGTQSPTLTFAEENNIPYTDALDEQLIRADSSVSICSVRRGCKFYKDDDFDNYLTLSESSLKRMKELVFIYNVRAWLYIESYEEVVPLLENGRPDWRYINIDSLPARQVPNIPNKIRGLLLLFHQQVQDGLKTNIWSDIRSFLEENQVDKAETFKNDIIRFVEIKLVNNQ
jgi:hypothetical protein